MQIVSFVSLGALLIVLIDCFEDKWKFEGHTSVSVTLFIRKNMKYIFAHRFVSYLFMIILSKCIHKTKLREYRSSNLSVLTDNLTESDYNEILESFSVKGNS